jgi:hypothetical protein
MVDLMTSAVDDDTVPRANVVAARDKLFGALVQHGTPAAIDRFARVYELGKLSDGGAGLCYLFSEGKPQETGYTPEQVGRIVSSCLAVGTPLVWRHVVGMLGGGKPPLPLEVTSVLCEAASRGPVAAPGPEGSEQAGLLEFRRRIVSALAKQWPAAPVVGMLRTLLASSEIGEQVLALAELCYIARDAPQTISSEIVTRVVELTGSPDRVVRSRAWATLAARADDRSLDTILPMHADQEEAVRKTFCTTALRLLDRRFVPPLLTLLRDPSQEVRDAAKAALDAIRYYVTETERGQRLLGDAGLDAGNAAEALLAQAKAGQPKAARLAAIASLGTLAVAETTPFLIQLLQDQDADVAAAAAAALEKINRK